MIKKLTPAAESGIITLSEDRYFVRFSQGRFLFALTQYPYIITQRPRAVATGTILTRRSNRNSRGRAISDPWHAVGPPEISKQKSRRSYRNRDFLKM
jgi:hypothetical protein